MERHKIPMLAQMYASEQRPIGFDQKDMMKTNRGLYQKGRNRAAICEGECHKKKGIVWNLWSDEIIWKQDCNYKGRLRIEE